MASIKHLEMAAALSTNEHVTIKKGFLGFGEKAVYEPTQSPIKIYLNDYTVDNGLAMEKILKSPVDKLEEEIRKSGRPESVQIGNMHLEACLSADHQFAAVQLFRFSDFKYTPVTDLKIYEGKEAGLIATLL